MGCAQSRIDNEESVTRCRDRRNHMKDAVSSRNAFAAAHTAYSVSLKNTGASLSDFSVSESFPSASESFPSASFPSGAPLELSLAPPPPPPPLAPHIDTLPPPPPPLPVVSPSPLKRSLTMPPDITVSPAATPGERGCLDLRGIDKSPMLIDEEGDDEEGQEVKLQNNLRRPPSLRKSGVVVTPPPPPIPESKGMVWDYFYMVENMRGSGLGDGAEVENEDEVHDDDNDDDDVTSNGWDGGCMRMRFEGNDGVEMEFKTPEKQKKVVVEDGEDLKMEVRAKEEAEVEGSTKAVTATATGQNMMKVMGAIDDHFLKASECAQEVSRMLEATRMHYHSNFADDRGHIDHSARVMRVITWNKSFKGLPNGDSGKDDFDADEYETHATILDKLLAWEKKLYEEVKQGELMKLEYQRKVALLNKQKKRSASAESLQKMKAAVSHLHTRYIVDMQSMDSTASEINQIRDHQLYPKLTQLVDGLTIMWEKMCLHHENQLAVVSDLRSLDVSVSQTPRETTRQHHKRTAQLEEVIQKWHSEFEKLVIHQKQYVCALNSWLKLNLIPIESSLKEKVSSPPRAQSPPIQALLVAWQDFLEKLPDEIAKTAISAFGAVIRTIMMHQEEELKLKDKYEETRKDFLRKNQAFEEWYQKYLQRWGHDGADRAEDVNPHDPVMEKRAAVESLRKRMEEEMEVHQRLCVQVREKSLGSLKTRLPELFRTMSDYSHACADSYARLRAVSQMHKSNGISS